MKTKMLKTRDSCSYFKKKKRLVKKTFTIQTTKFKKHVNFFFFNCHFQLLMTSTLKFLVLMNTFFINFDLFKNKREVYNPFLDIVFV